MLKMYTMYGILYLLLIGFEIKCQTSSETETENPLEQPPNDESSSANSVEDATEKPSITTDSASELSDSTITTQFSTEETISPLAETEIDTTVITESTTTSNEAATEKTTTGYSSLNTESSYEITNSETTTSETSLCSTSATSIAPNLPNITISLPTSTPSNTAATSLCRENEIYSCLPLCPRTCNNPISQIICHQIPSYNRLCRRGCTCKRGYLLEKTIGRCVQECPAKQPL